MLAADDASVIVSKLEGIFRYALDGSGEQRIADFVTARQNITSQSGQWAYTDYDYQTQTENVYVYEVGGAPRRLGCIDARGATVHALALTDSSVLVSRYRDSAATLVRFDL